MTKNEVHIHPAAKESLLDIKELSQYRELFYIFAWRDLKVRYRQTLLGVIWVIGQPIMNTFIFTILFGTLAKIPSGNLPYTLFVLCGLIYWSFFSMALSESIESIIANQAIVKKVYFPKMILILASVLTRLVDFVIMFVLLLVVALILGYVPSLALLYVLPVTIIITMVTAAGLGLALAALNVTYRDVRYVMPFAIQMLFYATPVVYPMAIVSERNRLILALNPMSTVIESIRWTFSGSTVLTVWQILISLTVSLVLALFGLWYFSRTQRHFADII
jgi:lipopolysaccharide transport system permease protein